MEAIDTGGYRRRVSRVSPANGGRWPHCRAFSKVDRDGLKRAAWVNATRLAREALPMAVLAWAGVGGWMSSSHNWEVGVREPCRMMLLLCRIVMVLDVKATSQPALQSCPMERRGCVARLGMTCPCWAEGGSPGMSRSASCVEWSMMPDGV